LSGRKEGKVGNREAGNVSGSLGLEFSECWGILKVRAGLEVNSLRKT